MSIQENNQGKFHNLGPMNFIVLGFWLIFLKYLFIYYVYNILSLCMPAGQKRTPDPIIDGRETPCGCWKLNSGLLEEQAMLLTSEPSLQPPWLIF